MMVDKLCMIWTFYCSYLVLKLLYICIVIISLVLGNRYKELTITWINWYTACFDEFMIKRFIVFVGPIMVTNPLCVHTNIPSPDYCVFTKIILLHEQFAKPSCMWFLCMVFLNTHGLLFLLNTPWSSKGFKISK